MDGSPSDGAIRFMTGVLMVSDILGIMGVLKICDIIINVKSVSDKDIILLIIMMIMLVHSLYWHTGLFSITDEIKEFAFIFAVALLKILGTALIYNIIINGVPIKDEVAKLIITTIIVALSTLGDYRIQYKICRMFG